MDIGDYPAGQIASFYCFTNGDSIRLYKNDVFVKEFSTTPFASLKHGPILIDDTIGDLLETQEHMPKQQAKNIRSCLLAARDYGLANLPLKNKLQFAKAMIFMESMSVTGEMKQHDGDLMPSKMVPSLLLKQNVQALSFILKQRFLLLS